MLVVEFRQLSVNGFVCECVSDFCWQLRGKEADPNVSLPVWQHGGGDLGAMVLLLYQPTSSTTEETCAAASQADWPVHDRFTNQLPAHGSHRLGRCGHGKLTSAGHSESDAVKRGLRDSLQHGSGMLSRLQSTQWLKMCGMNVCTLDNSVDECTMDASELTVFFVCIFPNLMSDFHVAWTVHIRRVFLMCCAHQVMKIFSRLRANSMYCQKNKNNDQHHLCTWMSPIDLNWLVCVYVCHESSRYIMFFGSSCCHVTRDSDIGNLSHKTDHWLSDVIYWWVMERVRICLKIQFFYKGLSIETVTHYISWHGWS